jgi:ATP-dependent DNA ligase
MTTRKSSRVWDTGRVVLPIDLPVSPMLAATAATLPTGDQWRFEPKWDGFRCIVVRDGDSLELTSRNERPLTRYFPEVLGPLAEQLPDRIVLDGELAIPATTGLDFDALTQRIHPAVSRVNRLAAETPAVFIAFDVLAIGDTSLLERSFDDRRAQLVELMHDATWPVLLTPLTADRTVAKRWFVQFEGAGLDGVVAKAGDTPYAYGQRTMVKVKHERTADCVVAGYRIHKDAKGIGSLLLGLHDDEGRLHHVGVASGFAVRLRVQLLEELTPLIDTVLDDHPWRDWAVASAHESARLPGAQSRWSAGKDLSFVALRPERVAEVRFSQLQSNRFRHGTSLLRWRPDRDPASCTYGQLDVALPMSLRDLMAST